MGVKKNLKGAADAVKSTTKKVVKKAEKALAPVGDAIVSEAKVVKKAAKKAAKKVVKKVGDSVEKAAEAVGVGTKDRKASPKKASAKASTPKKASAKTSAPKKTSAKKSK